MPEITERMLTDNDQYVRWRAMTVLRDLEEGAEVKALLKALRDPSSEVKARRNAASFLGELQVAADRHAAGDAGHPHPEGLDQPRQVQGGGVPLHVGAGGQDHLLDRLGP